MIESPVIQALIAKRLRAAIKEVLKGRFGAVPKDVAQGLESILNEKELTKLNVFAARCPDIKAFRERLGSARSPGRRNESASGAPSRASASSTRQADVAPVGEEQFRDPPAHNGQLVE
jgi:hypothetical protein